MGAHSGPDTKHQADLHRAKTTTPIAVHPTPSMARNINDPSPAMSMNELLPSISIAAFLSAREGIRERLATIHALIAETDTMADQAGFGPILKDVAFERVGRFARANFLQPDGLDPLLHKLDVRGWEHLMYHSGMLPFLDRTARTEWRERVAQGDVPPLSEENIAGVFQTLHQDRRMMMERGVVAVFRRLSWDATTDRPIRFGMQIALQGILNYQGWLNDIPTASIHALDDLVRALHWLDGTAQPDHRTPVAHAIRGAGTYDFPYFSMTVYKKGTGHLTFKNPALVEGLNKILTQHAPDALPAPRHGKRRTSG